MERKTEFIALTVSDNNSKNLIKDPELRFINRSHITQIWQQGPDVIIELIDYQKLKIHNENIHVLMDRFV